MERKASTLEQSSIRNTEFIKAFIYVCPPCADSPCLLYTFVTREMMSDGKTLTRSVVIAGL